MTDCDMRDRGAMWKVNVATLEAVISSEDTVLMCTHKEQNPLQSHPLYDLIAILIRLKLKEGSSKCNTH